MLSNQVSSTLDLDGITAGETQNNTNLYQITTTYRDGSEVSDCGSSFTLEFNDTRYLDVYMLFKIYDEYFREKYKRDIIPVKISYIDDYAHHPKELSTAISSMRDIFPGRKLTAIFQPHLYTRTRDFADDFAAALSKVDKLILLDIYPAREEPIPGVTSEIIFDKVTAPEKVMLHKEELMGYLEKEPVDVLITFGAGNIADFIAPITELLEKRIRG